MPSRAYTSFLRKRNDNELAVNDVCVNALMGLYLISTYTQVYNMGRNLIVSMPSRASTSLLQEKGASRSQEDQLCQCPHGLVPHCYGIEHIVTAIDEYGCQCPHGLVPHCYV